MGKVVVARRSRSKWKAWVEKKKKKESKRKKQALAECECKKKLKEQEKKRKEEKEKRKEQEEKRLRHDAFISKCSASYWPRVRESDGFDIGGLWLPSIEAMVPFNCKNTNDCPLIVRLYAKMGLHRYNLLKGTNLQFCCVERYNTGHGILRMPLSYYITLVAVDPATGSLIPFQASCHESKKHELHVRFYLARPQNTGPVGTTFSNKTAPEFYHISAPKWPDDEKQFYLVQESEWEENDWIRLYLELLFVTTNRRIPNPPLTDLKIVEVMVETKETLKGFRDATVYIKYIQDLGDGRVCKRRAIVRRCVDLTTERMCLMGDDYLES